MLDYDSELGTIALQALWNSVLFLFSFCLQLLLEVSDISPLP